MIALQNKETGFFGIEDDTRDAARAAFAHSGVAGPDWLDFEVSEVDRLESVIALMKFGERFRTGRLEIGIVHDGEARKLAEENM